MKFFSSFFGGGRKPKRDHSSRGKKLIDENGERDASLGRTDESNNYGDEEHLHKCLSERGRERERKRKYLEKVGPENEETSSSCNELEIFRFSSTWRSSLRDSYRADLL